MLPSFVALTMLSPLVLVHRSPHPMTTISKPSRQLLLALRRCGCPPTWQTQRTEAPILLANHNSSHVVYSMVPPPFLPITILAIEENQRYILCVLTAKSFKGPSAVPDAQSWLQGIIWRGV